VTENKPQRHHYVPRFYLNGFALEPNSRTVAVFDKQDGRAFLANTSKIAVERHFHTIADDASFERQIAVWETDWSQVHDKLLALKNANLLTEVERKTYAEFLGYQLVRTARFRAKVSEALCLPIFTTFSDNPSSEQKVANSGIAKAVLENLAQNSLTHLVNSELLQQIQEASQTGVLGNMLRPTSENLESKLAEGAKQKHLEEIDALAKEKTDILMQARWVVTENATSAPFMTSDHPVQVFDRSVFLGNTSAHTHTKNMSDIDYIFRVLGNVEWIDSKGALKPELFIYMPLSPKLALFMSDKTNSHGTATFDDANLITIFNNFLVFQAEKYLFSCEKNFIGIYMHNLSSQIDSIIPMVLNAMIAQRNPS